MSLWLILSASATLLFAGLAIFVILRPPPDPLWPVIAIVQLAGLLYCGGDLASGFLTTTPAWHLFWLRVEYLGIATLPASWWFLALRFAETQGFPLPWGNARWARLPIPIAAILWTAMLTNPWHGQFLTAQVGRRSEFHGLFWVQAGWDYLLIVGVLGVYAWLRSRLRGAAAQKHTTIMMAAAGSTLLMNVFYLFWPSPPSGDATVVGLALASLAFVYAINGTGLFGLLPVTLPEITRADPDAVLLVDEGGPLLYANPAGLELFGPGTLYAGVDVFGLLAERLRTPDDVTRPLARADVAEALLEDPQPRAGRLYHIGADVTRWVRIEAMTLTGRWSRGRVHSLRLREVTDFKRATEAMDQQAAALEAILNSTHEGILVVDHTGTMVYFNRLFQDMWRLPDEVMATGEDASVLEFLRDRFADPVGAIARLREIYAQPLAVSLDEVRLADGRTIERTSKPLMREGRPAGRVWSFRDVTEQRRNQEALRQNEATLRQVIDLVPVFIFAKDAAGRYILANRAVADAFGTTVEELVARNEADFLGSAEEAAAFRRDDLAVLRSGRPKFVPEEQITDASGRVRLVQTTKIPFKAPGEESPAVLGVAVDITERKAAVDALRRQESLLRGVASATTHLLTAPNHTEAITRALEALGRAAEVDRVYIMRIHPHPTSGRPAASLVDRWHAADAPALAEDLPLEDVAFEDFGLQPWYDTLAAGGTVAGPVRDFAQIATDYLDAQDVASLLLAPIFVHDELWGLVGFDDCRTARHWTQNEESILSAMAASLAGAIEREEAKAALEVSEARYRHLVMHAPLGLIACDRTGRVLAVNEQLVAMLGSPSVDATLAINLLEFPLLIEAGISPALRRCFETGDPFTGDISYTSKWGKSLTMRVHLAPVRDAEGVVSSVQAIAEDVTERLKTEEALSEFKTSLDVTLDCVFMFRPDDLRFFYVNQGAIDQVGYSGEELLHMTPLDIKPAFDEAGFREMLAPLLDGRLASHTFETIHLHKNGTEVPVEVFLQYIAPRGERGRFVAIVRDITERKQAEAALLHTQKLESLGVLAGGIAHDFNNLLVSVMGNAGLALGEVADGAPAHGYLIGIEKAAERASELTQRLLAYAGKGKFVVEPLDLSEVVEELTHLLDVSISKNVLIHYDLAQDLPAVQADVAQLRQVVMNLVINASDAVGDADGVVSIRTRATTIDTGEDLEHFDGVSGRALQPGPYVRLEVQDTGTGMDPSTRARMFDPFFTTKFTGRGLGLAAVLGIVRGHSGAISVETTPGAGSTFTVLLPQAVATAARPAAMPPRPRNGEPSSDTWRGEGTILVVDDDPHVADVARLVLEKVGFTVVTASDGAQALDIVAKRGASVTAVLLDMTMPRMSGEETFNRLRACRTDLPVILSTGYSEEEALARFAGKGLAGFVQKPYRARRLVSVVRRAVEAGAAAA